MKRHEEEFMKAIEKFKEDKGKKILAQYGAADSDFSAQAWIIG